MPTLFYQRAFTCIGGYKMRRSFTVVELLVAVGLTMVIGVIVSMAFQNTQLASQRATSALEYYSKGRAIMDLIASDIRSSYCNGTADPQLLSSTAITTPVNGNISHVGIAGMACVPIQRSHYKDAGSDGTATPALVNSCGYYYTDVIRYGWCYSSTTQSLYRRTSKPSETYGSTAATILSSGNYTGTSDFYTTVLGKEVVDADADRVTSGDMAEFSVIQEASVSGFTVSFALTNVPAGATESPISATDADNIINRESEALSAGYIWIEFERFIPTTPF